MEEGSNAKTNIYQKTSLYISWT